MYSVANLIDVTLSDLITFQDDKYTKWRVENSWAKDGGEDGEYLLNKNKNVFDLFLW